MRINEIAPEEKSKLKHLKRSLTTRVHLTLHGPQHNKHGKLNKKEPVNFNPERDEVKAILDKYGIKNPDDVEYGSRSILQELYNYFAQSVKCPWCYES